MLYIMHARLSVLRETDRQRIMTEKKSLARWGKEVLPSSNFSALDSSHSAKVQEKSVSHSKAKNVANFGKRFMPSSNYSVADPTIKKRSRNA